MNTDTVRPTNESSLTIPSSAATRIMDHSLRPRGGSPAAGTVSLALGEPDFPTPGIIVDAMDEALRAGYTHYADSNGDPELRAAIAEEVNTVNGASYTADDVLVSHGGSGALAAAILATVGPGDRVIIPEPTYSLYSDLVRLAGAEPVFVPLDADLHLDLDAIADEIHRARLVILCNPGNPTGAVFPGEQLRALGAVAAESSALILVDEAYSDLVYDHAFVSAAAVESLRERLILVGTFSKSFAMTGWRLGWVLAPAAIIEPARIVHRTFNGGINAAIQRAALVAIRHRRELVAPMLEQYRERRDHLVNLLTGTNDLSFRVPEGAFYLFARYSRPEPSTEITALLRENGVLVRAGREYGPSGERHVRLSFATDRATLEIGVQRMLGVLAP